MVQDDLMTIGVFARRSRLSQKALRLYDAHGVLVPASIDPDNGYRRYRSSQLDDARLIRMLRHLGMPLGRIGDLIVATSPRRAELLSQYWSEVEAEHSARRYLTMHLRLTLSSAKGSYDMFDIHLREVDEQLVLTEQRHVRVDELPRWIGTALTRQHQALEAADARAAGPSLVIYHGEVTEDSDGPAEACTPVQPAAATRLALPTRTEPAHREAYTTLTKAQVAYPQILSAYDAVEAWTRDNGHTITGSPREVYFTDFDAAGPDDPVTDIAFPVN
jgi:DNA-binding transcriptional MerR regulator